MSSARITKGTIALLLLGGAMAAGTPAQTAPAAGNPRMRTSTGGSAAAQPADPAQAFQRGQEALAAGRLDEAERNFRQVLAADPKAGAAYANLGVVYMRRQQWTKALEMLHKAERMMPQVAGIRLNIGLAYYRQNEFLKAIPPFESVVQEQPEALQPRYLLGLCYFFADRWADAAATLEPLWKQESGHLPYLYVLSNAAHRAGRKELDDRASSQLIQIGGGSPEYSLFVGKYYLNLGQYDQALAAFQGAAEANPKLPFVHFNLGLAYVRKQDYEHARDEFLKDAAVEPDLALNYDQLGDLYWLMQDDVNAEKSYREALRRDARLVNSHLGLAKVYQQRQRYAQALAEVDAAERLDPARPDIHYLRGRVLAHLGRKEEAKRESDAAARLQQGHHIEQPQEKEAEPVPSPELLQEQQ